MTPAPAKMPLCLGLSTAQVKQFRLQWWPPKLNARVCRLVLKGVKERWVGQDYKMTAPMAIVLFGTGAWPCGWKELLSGLARLLAQSLAARASRTLCVLVHGAGR